MWLMKFVENFDFITHKNIHDFPKTNELIS